MAEHKLIFLAINKTPSPAEVMKSLAWERRKKTGANIDGILPVYYRHLLPVLSAS